MVGHLREFFSDESERLGEAKIRQAIRHGIRRAEQHRITAQRDVAKYIDLTFTFGFDLDSNPAFPWAAEILRGSQPPQEKIEALFRKAKENIRQAQGIDASVPVLS
jgi:hypothetical protein